jgi:hypothetical protein
MSDAYTHPVEDGESVESIAADCGRSQFCIGRHGNDLRVSGDAFTTHGSRYDRSWAKSRRVRSGTSNRSAQSSNGKEWLPSIHLSASRARGSSTWTKGAGSFETTTCPELVSLRTVGPSSLVRSDQKRTPQALSLEETSHSSSQKRNALMGSGTDLIWTPTRVPSNADSPMSPVLVPQTIQGRSGCTL